MVEMQKKDAIKSIRQLLKNGFFHITGSNVINKVIAVITNILITRTLGKQGYGVFSTAYNVYSIFVIFSGLGMYSAILLYCSEKRSDNEKRAYYIYGLRAGFAASILLSVGMALYAFFVPLGIPEIRTYILLLCLLPLVDYVMQYVLIILRTQQENKKYALLLNINSIAYLVLGYMGAYFGGISGTILGSYFSYFVVILISIPSVIPFMKSKTDINFCLGKKEKRALWGYSLKNGGSCALNQILYLIDVALIAALVKDAKIVASYKVAVTIPEGISFIPMSIMVYLLPFFAQHNNDRQWLSSKIKKLFFLTGILNAVISVTLCVGAPYIISILWGKEYLDGVFCFRILSVNYFVLGTFRMTCTNVLATLHKVDFNLILGIVSGVLDIILDVVLIQRYGAVGAAFATLICVCFISIFSVPYLLRTIRNIGVDKDVS